MRENGGYIRPRRRVGNALTVVTAAAVVAAAPSVALYHTLRPNTAVSSTSEDDANQSVKDCGFGRTVHRSEIPNAKAALVVKERLDVVTEKSLGYLCVSLASDADVMEERFLGIRVEHDGNLYAVDESDAYTQRAGWIALESGIEFDVTGTAESVGGLYDGQLYSESLRILYEETVDETGNVIDRHVTFPDFKDV